MLTATVRRVSITWKAILSRILTVKFESNMWSISIVQHYAPMKTSDSKETRRLPKGEIVILASYMNVKVESDPTSFEYVTRNMVLETVVATVRSL